MFHVPSVMGQEKVSIHRYLATHRRRKVKNIGGPRFRILGGGGGGKGGQIPSRHKTSYWGFY